MIYNKYDNERCQITRPVRLRRGDDFHIYLSPQHDRYKLYEVTLSDVCFLIQCSLLEDYLATKTIYENEAHYKATVLSIIRRYITSDYTFLRL